MFGPPWGPPPRWRGPKARRGDVRAAILAVLAEQPMNGYQIIQEIAERSGGAWKPSPGSIYPTLQQLEDEGLVTADAEVGRRTFTLTDEGRAYVAEHQDEVSAPWEAMSAPAADDENGLKPMLGQVATAMWQILATGTPEQQAKAREAAQRTAPEAVRHPRRRAATSGPDMSSRFPSGTAVTTRRNPAATAAVLGRRPLGRC